MLSKMLIETLISLIIENLRALFWFRNRANGIAVMTSKNMMKAKQTI